MATTVEPIGSTGGQHMHRNVSGSTPVSPVGKNRLDYIKSMGWLNRGFIFSISGGLQIAVVVRDYFSYALNVLENVNFKNSAHTTYQMVGLINVSLLGAAMKHEDPKVSHYAVFGISFHAFLFDVAFWCFMTSTVILVTSATSVNTASSLPKTTFVRKINLPTII